MTDKIVFFGLNRKPAEYAHIPYIKGRAFIEVQGDKGEAREDLFSCIRKGVTVAILSDADLGRGAAIPRFYMSVEALGGHVCIYNNKRSAIPNDIDEDLRKNVCKIWEKPLRESDRLAQINDLKGVKRMNKAQVYYLCVTKRKRQQK